QPYSDNYYQAPKPQRSNATSSSTRPSVTTRHKGKEIAKPVTPQPEYVSEEDSDPEQAQRDKDMKKNLALLAKYFKKLYKPTNNNLQTSSNSRNKTEDTTPSQVVQQTGIQCFNCKGYGHYAKECMKPKRKDDSNVTPDSSNICTNDNQVDQNAAECVDERDALANLTLDTEESKMILKQLKKANASLTQELEKCKTNLDETNSALGEVVCV
ncbi:retrovirus-related pol polyprotein from transposon TNT 1-94, partial [Tanacetum coccineum]